ELANDPEGQDPYRRHLWRPSVDARIAPPATVPRRLLARRPECTDRRSPHHRRRRRLRSDRRDIPWARDRRRGVRHDQARLVVLAGRTHLGPEGTDLL